MKTAHGEISYTVGCECPHCDEYLELNGGFYADEDTTNELGLCVFGRVDTTAKWDGISIQYICEHCGKEFLLTSLGY